MSLLTNTRHWCARGLNKAVTRLEGQPRHNMVIKAKYRTLFWSWTHHSANCSNLFEVYRWPTVSVMLYLWALHLLCSSGGLHILQWQLIWSVHWVFIGLRVLLPMLVPCKIHKDLEYQWGKESAQTQDTKNLHTHSTEGPVDISLPSSFFSFPHPLPLKQTEIVVQTTGACEWDARQGLWSIK